MDAVAPRTRRSTAHDSLIVTASQGLKIALYGLSIVVLSRVLTQSEFGLITMVTAFVGVGELFRDFGLSLATIQAPTISREQRSNLFWLNVSIGAVLAVLAAALSGPLSVFYGRPAVAPLVLIVALIFVSNGVAAQYRAGLVRERRFVALTVADVSGLCIAFFVALSLALGGLGATALAAQILAQSLVATVVVVALGRWAPGLPKRRASIRSFVGFSANLLAVQVLTYAGRNVDNVVIGRAFGPLALGYYSKAYQLYSQPQNQGIGPLTDLAVNALSRVQDEPEVYLRRLGRIQRATTYAALTGFAVMIAAAHPLVRVLLGPGWDETADLLRILSIGGTFQILGNVYFWLFLSKGLARVQLIAVLVTQPIAIAAVFVGALWGSTGVAWAVSGGMVLEWLVPATWGAAKAGVDPMLLLRNTVRPLILAAGMFAVVLTVVLVSEPLGAVLQLVVGLLAGAAWVGLVWAVSATVRADLSELARQFLRRSKRDA